MNIAKYLFIYFTSDFEKKNHFRMQEIKTNFKQNNIFITLKAMLPRYFPMGPVPISDAYTIPIRA